jgi:cysteine synthase B
MKKTLEEFVGNTPLVRPAAHPRRGPNVLLAKLEGQQPGGSVKDRPALSMILGAERPRRDQAGRRLIEATSGNTGIALAMVAAMRGYRMVLVMPEHLSVERRQTMAAFGAQFVLTPEKGGMELARDTAERMREAGEGVILDQFANPDNPLAHYVGTGPEIWRDTQGKITHFVATMGTTGTIMGCSRFLKEKNPAIQVIGVQPKDGASVPGIRKWPAAYLPKIFDRQRIDRVIEVNQEESEEMTRRLAREEGIFAGISSGGGLAAAMRLVVRGEGRGDRAHRVRSRRPLPVDRRVSRLMTPILVFDIETIPDAEGLRKLWELGPEVSEDAVIDLVQQRRRQATGNDFLPAHLQKVVAISCALRSNDGLRVWSLGSPQDSEAEVVKRFFDGIEKYKPQLVSWNGSGFDLPVLPLPRHDPRHPGLLLLGPGRERPRVQVQQLPLALPRAPHRPDGRPRGLPEPRVGAAGRDRAALRAARQARHGRLAGVSRFQARGDRGDPQLLRD